MTQPTEHPKAGPPAQQGIARRALLQAAALSLALPAGAQGRFRIASGTSGGSYFSVAGALASLLSEPGMGLQAQASSGSVANVNAVSSAAVESGLSQADVAAWHYSGTGLSVGVVRPSAKLGNLRLIASLYAEPIHVVVRKSLNVQSIEGLKGLKVGLNEPGSGVLINARQILKAHGLSERDIAPSYAAGPLAAQRLAAGTLDALFFVGGAPSAFITELAGQVPIALLAIEGRPAEVLQQANPFLVPSQIAASAYPGTMAVNSLAVNAQWLTHDKADEAVIYRLTQKLLSLEVASRLAAALPGGAGLSLASAVRGAALPFHPGAERFYREAGALK